MKVKALCLIKHNGKTYQLGDAFECSNEQAEYLLAEQDVEKVAGKSPPPVPPPPRPRKKEGKP